MCEDKGRGNFQRCKLTVYEIGNVRGRGKRLLSGVDIDNKIIQLLRSLLMLIINFVVQALLVSSSGLLRFP